MQTHIPQDQSQNGRQIEGNRSSIYSKKDVKKYEQLLSFVNGKKFYGEKDWDKIANVGGGNQSLKVKNVDQK